MKIATLIEKYEDVFSDLSIIVDRFRNKYSTQLEFSALRSLIPSKEGLKLLNLPYYLRTPDIKNSLEFVQEYFENDLPDFELKDFENKCAEWFQLYDHYYYPL